MFLRSKRRLFTFGTLFIVSALTVVPVGADNLKADLKICVQDHDRKPIKNATVVLKGGKTDVKLTGDTDGCYRNKGISFDTTKEYSIDIRADSYESITRPVDISRISANSEVTLDAVALTLSGSAPSSTPTSVPLATATPPESPTTFLSSTAVLAISIASLLLVAAFGLTILWRHSNRLSDVGNILSQIRDQSGSIAGSIKDMSVALNAIKTSLALNGQKQERQVEVLAGIEEGLQRIKGLELQNNISSNTSTPSVHSVPPPADAGNLAARELSDKERSVIAYERFLNGENVSPEPLRLGDVGGSSADDLLGGRSVLLEENVQGALVLLRIREMDTRGFIYPDTKWKYRGPELTSVFPRMTYEQYECLRTKKTPHDCGFEPVAVKLDPINHKWQLDGASENEST
jgi:hypothetical protein